MSPLDFTEYLGKWGLGVNMQPEPDCFDCGNTGLIATSAASVTIDVPCPSCPRSDWHAHDAAAGWAEQ